MRDKPVICVLGAGLMGHGIAQVFAVAGHDVAVFDASADALASLLPRIRANLLALGLDVAAADRVRPCGVLADAVVDADVVIEAAAENLAIKQALFAEVEAHARPEAILASNTSVIPITAIMSGLQRRGRALGTHWWNPPFLVPLVEVVGTEWTDPACITDVIALLTAVGKTAVHVRKDVAGFIGNRLQHALWREAISLVEQGICDAETVDIVVKASFGRRLAVLGPLENADLVGTDLTLAIHEIVQPEICSTPGASAYLRDLVAAGKLGMKSGEGFRSWTADEQAELRTRLLNHLKDAAP